MNSLQKWYDGMTKGQRVFLYLISIPLILVYGFGLLPLAILIYCHLGAGK